MAELAASARCCSRPARAECCAPEEKDACCGAAEDTCGCAESARLCTLDERELRAQLARYGAAGAGGQLVERDRRGLTLEVAQAVDVGLIDELIAVERACCPFFAIAWERDSRRLSISVADAEHEPALDALVSALGF